MPAAPTSGLPRLLRTLVVVGALAASTVATAALPAVAAADEPGTTVTGRLLQAWPESEHHDDAAHGPLTWVETAEGSVRVPTEDVEGVPAGSTVQLTVGDAVEDEGSREHGLDPAQDVLSTDGVVTAAPPAPVRGPITNQVTVVLVAPAGTTRDADVTPDQVAHLVDGEVGDFWRAQTGGAVSFGVSARHDWISTTAGCDDPTRMWNEAATAVEFRPGPGKHLLLHLSSQTREQAGCSYALAEVGLGPASGGRLYVRTGLASVIAHELGHNLGLTHSSGLQCDAGVETGSCRTTSYRDHYDVMGYSWELMGSLNAPQAARLNAIPAGQLQQLAVHDAATGVALAPLAGQAGTRALRLTDAEGTDYWLEYRAATGQDAWLGTQADRYGLDSGVLLRRSAGWPDTSLLLDGTPSTSAAWNTDLQAALPLGIPVTLSGGDFTVTLRVQDEGAAVVDVVPTAPATAVAPPPSAPSGGSGVGQVLAGGTADQDAAIAPPAPTEAPEPRTYEVAALSPAPQREVVPERSRGDLVVVGSAAALAGAALLLARRMRAARLP